MIRAACAADVPAILEIYAPYVLHSTATFEYDVPCRREFTRRFETVTAQFPWLVWEEAGQILGYAYASPPFQRAAYSWCAEATVYLRPQAQGIGIARALYTVLETILKKQGYQVVYALICGENSPSLRFHEKMGYRVCGEFPDCGFKFGRWLDLIWMEKRLSVVKTPSAFPLPWLSIVQNTEIFSDILDNLSLS
ncbi:MAG: GNAT family N-acetyltransferase [Faecousia sp.]